MRALRALPYLVALACLALGACQAAAPDQAADAKKVMVPDRPNLRRLTREQYDNSVQDVLGLDAGLAQAFVEDEVNAGFSANATRPLQDLALDQYRGAAEELAKRVVSGELGRLLPCSSQGGAQAGCADGFIRDVGSRIYRRPLTSEEVDRHTALFLQGAGNGGLAHGIELVLQAMLQSPYFLYRVELGDSGARAEDGSLPLTGYEMATRLSYLLFESTPDVELRAQAARGELRSSDSIASTLARMLADPRAQRGLVSFHSQWLGFANLASLAKQDAAFTPELRDAMRTEVETFIDHVVRAEDGKLETLLSGGFTYADPAIRGFYGLPTEDLGFQRVALPPDRAGILTLPALLATHAHPEQTSPVPRGLLVRSQLLCQPVAPPPPTVDTTLPKVDASATTRIRFEQHRSDPACAGCHELMDPLGTPFEGFDAIGRSRAFDGAQPVDASGKLVGSTSHDGDVLGAVDLAKRLATDETVRRCFARQWFRFSFGRQELGDDERVIDEAYVAFQASEYRITNLISSLATSYAFGHLSPPNAP